ncbi:MAG: endonuclease [Cryomorphaceae bacterium]
MKQFFTLSFLIFLASFGFSQTTLPTSWDFATTPASLPTGWSTNTTASYSSGLPDNTGGTSRAGKLQATGHYVTINFFDDPGVVTYNLRAYSSNGANFTGTFAVEESVNGSTWSTLEEYTDDDFGNSWTEYSTTANSSSRYIRFYFSDKVSGINVGLDDVSIDETSPTEQEINVQYASVDLPSGTGVQFATGVGNPITLKFGIQNLGSVGSLVISSTAFSGSASGEYSVSSSPSSIAPLSSDTLSITFDPATTGTRMAQISIGNNDANEDPYLIDLNGIGGNGASEPNSPPASPTIEYLTTFRVKVTFSQSDADHYLVVFKKNAPVSFTPQDGLSYEVGQGVGNAKVAGVGDIDYFWLREATADDTFFVKVFAYNGTDPFTNYLQSDPMDTVIVTPKRTTQFLNYYANVDETQPSFVEDLHDVIYPHSVRFYSNYATDMIPRLLERDTTNNKSVITGVYSGDNVVFSSPFGWSENNMNREHTLPYSWMPSNGSTNTPEYQDFHHLFPTIATANSQRSNEPLGNVVNVTSSYGAGKRGTDAFGNTVYEPRDAQKGDAARAMFYMMTTYHDPIGDHWGLEDLLTNGPNQRLDVLLEWHMTDLPGGTEQSRNDYLDSLQENRNPFIDSAHWACYINFRTMEHIAEPDSACLLATLPIKAPDDTDTTIGYEHVQRDHAWLFYPNPASDQLFVQKKDGMPFDLEIIDLLGRSFVFDEGFIGGWITLEGLPAGVYLVSMRGESGSESFRLVKE